MWRAVWTTVALASLVAPGPAAAATHQVEVGGVHGFAFSPQSVTIQPGDTVTWTNLGGLHSVTADNGSFNTGTSASDFTFSHTYPAAGTFGYHCQEHGGPGVGMFGTVFVQTAEGPPAPPTNLAAVATSANQIDLTWSDNSTNEVGFLVERRTIGETFQSVGVAGPGATTFQDTSLEPSTFYLYRVRANGSSSSSPFSNQASTATLGLVTPCVAGSTTHCLNGGRFRVELEWRIADGTSGLGQAVTIPGATDSGLFYFFSPSNLEMLLKVLNACVPPFNRYWVFFAATTNVELAVVVTDTQTGKTKAYYNPLNRPVETIQDNEAFNTCP